MILANRIRKIREAKELSQEDVAEKLGISCSAYGQIERRAQNSSFNTLLRVAKCLGVSLPFLVDIENFDFIEKNKL